MKTMSKGHPKHKRNKRARLKDNKKQGKMNTLTIMKNDSLSPKMVSLNLLLQKSIFH